MLLFHLVMGTLLLWVYGELQYANGRLVTSALMYRDRPLLAVFSLNTIVWPAVLVGFSAAHAETHLALSSLIAMQELWSVAVLLTGSYAFYLGSRHKFAKIGLLMIKKWRGAQIAPLKSGEAQDTMDDTEAFNLAMASIFSSAVVAAGAALATYGLMGVVGSFLHFAQDIVLVVAIFSAAALFLVAFCRLLLRLLTGGSASK